MQVSRWTVGLLFVGLFLLLPPFANAQLMLHGDGGHSNGCLIDSGAFPVGFTAYRVAETKAESVAPGEVFCEHLPQTGTFNMTVDLYDYALRAMPIALRMVRETGTGVEGIQSWPARIYPSGNVAVSVKLEQPGRYALLLNVSKTTPSVVPDVRIPLHVGNGEVPYFFMAGIGAAIVFGIAGYLWKRKRRM
jgi:hypothetical protein